MESGNTDLLDVAVHRAEGGFRVRSSSWTLTPRSAASAPPEPVFVEKVWLPISVVGSENTAPEVLLT